MNKLSMGKTPGIINLVYKTKNSLLTLLNYKTMKSNILIAILGLFLGLANMSMAQVNPNYKQQASGKKEKTEATLIYSFSSDSYEAAHNYKQSAALKDVVIIPKSEVLPSCCTDVKARTMADYKHPLSKDADACNLGYVCKKDVKGACCN
ncbi:MAG: hypothetical protein K2X86_08215 [Cytophagaceae bacterium]|nr:hypothetical protein [Cytophagaceae bacterium]